jgi:hypothetical protein
MSGEIAAFGRALARHPGLSHRDCADLLGAMAAAASALEAGQRDPQRLEEASRNLAAPLRDVFRDCVRAYEQEPAAAGPVEALAREIARHPGLSHRDCAELFRALAGVAARLDAGMWDGYELRKVTQAVPLHLRGVFQACVQAYERGR